MLTIESIVKATKQANAYGETDRAGSHSHLTRRMPTAVEHRRPQDEGCGKGRYVPARVWDDKLKIFRRPPVE